MTYILRPWRVSDVEQYRDAVDSSLDQFRPWMNWASEEPRSVADTATLLASYAADFIAGVRWRYAIVERMTDTIIGGLSIHNRIGPGGRDFGYWLRASHQGRGIMTLCLSALMERVFEDPSIDRVEIHYYEGNERSSSVARRLGFTHVGSVMVPVGNIERRSIIYRLLRSEYEAISPPRADAATYVTIHTV